MARKKNNNRPATLQPAASRPSEPLVPRRLTLCVCVALFVLAAIPFVQVGWHEFTVCDDNDYIFENPIVVRGLTAEGFNWAWSYHLGNWHPLTWLSHMADCQVFGLWAGGHHLVNVALHAASAVLLFWPSA